MWFTVLIMAAAVSTEPFRLGMTVLILNRPRPVQHLLAFLVGAFVMAMAVGLIVLFVLHTAIAQAADLTLPTLQVVIGAAALLIAAVLASGVRIRRSARAAESPGQPARWHRLVNGKSPFLAGVAGTAIALPSVDYLAALTVILASGESPAQQVGALVAFNIVAFAFVEIPLAGYLFAPNRTRRLMDALNGWMAANRRLTVAAMLALVGLILVISGLVGLRN